MSVSNRLQSHYHTWLQNWTWFDGVLISSLFVVTWFNHTVVEWGMVLLMTWLLLGIVSHDFRRSPMLWLLVSLTLVGLNGYTWQTTDNHKWLFTLWAIVITVSLLPRYRFQTEAILASNARWLIILVMLFAVLQKTLDPTYLDGSFFTYTYLVDGRFATVTSWLAGISETDLINNADRVRVLLQDPTISSTTLTTNAAVTTLGFITTWWVWLVELAIGLFLLLSWSRLQRWGHVLNQYFIVVTYTIAPVFGFGLLLTICGALATKANNPRLYRGYLLVGAYLLGLMVAFSIIPH
jgi:hypothetical protein